MPIFHSENPFVPWTLLYTSLFQNINNSPKDETEKITLIAKSKFITKFLIVYIGRIMPKHNVSPRFCRYSLQYITVFSYLKYGLKQIL